jgi:hypothetical protein
MSSSSPQPRGVPLVVGGGVDVDLDNAHAGVGGAGRQSVVTSSSESCKAYWPSAFTVRLKADATFIRLEADATSS